MMLVSLPFVSVEEEVATAHFGDWWCWCSISICFIHSWNCC